MLNVMVCHCQQIDHGQDLEYLSEMRVVSTLFINMILPATGDQVTWAVQRAFEIIHESVRRYRGIGINTQATTVNIKINLKY